jgi:hypothetical protein
LLGLAASKNRNFILDARHIHSDQRRAAISAFSKPDVKKFKFKAVVFMPEAGDLKLRFIFPFHFLLLFPPLFPPSAFILRPPNSFLSPNTVQATTKKSQIPNREGGIRCGPDIPSLPSKDDDAYQRRGY